MSPRRGEIWWTRLGSPQGSESGLHRPVVVVQSNEFNRSRLFTVVVAAVTSNLSLADAPGNIRISTKTSGLPKPSAVNVSQLATIDRQILEKKIGTLTAREMNAVAEGLRLLLAL